MRAFRVLTAALLVASGLTALGPDAVADPAPPYTVVTASGYPTSGGGSPLIFDTGVSVPSPTTSGISITAGDANLSVSVGIAPPTGQTLTEGATYDTGRFADATHAAMDITSGSSGCNESVGTLHVRQLTADGGGTVTAFAADYTYRCDAGAPVAGALRFQSTIGYDLVVPDVNGWNFGGQITKHNGWADSVHVTNKGTSPQTVAAAVTNTKTFSVRTSGCTGVAVGASCSVVVTPHPQLGGVQTGTLTVTATGAPTLHLQLYVTGLDYYPLVAQAGPERVTVSWDQLPAPADTSAEYARIYRGTSKSSLHYLRRVVAWNKQSVNTALTAGRTYYYAVQPQYGDGSVGPLSPVVAARPWPKYSAGMYHRLSSAVRLVNAHRVQAGHPYALRVAGTAGIPSSHVSAVALTVTAASPTSATQVYAYPSGTKRPAAADLAVRRGDTRSNFVLAKVGSHGRVLIATTHGSVPVSVDVAGYFSGSGLSTKYGQGAALHAYGWPGTILDTTKWKAGPLKAGYYANAPVNFDPSFARHVSSLLVEVTAIGGQGSGTITGFTTNRRPGATSVLAYRPHVTTSSTAIIRAGLWYDDYDGNDYPSVSFLNRGKKSVHLVVTILGYFDDNTVLFGQRYTPTAARHLFGAKVASGGNRTLRPGSAGGYWTSAFNEKLTATNPARTTTVSLRGVGLGAAPARGQLHAPAHVTTVSSTIGVTGAHGNEIALHDAGGTARIDVWSFGRFDAYPIPSTHDYAAVGAKPSAAAPGSVPGGTAGGVRYRRS